MSNQHRPRILGHVAERLGLVALALVPFLVTLVKTIQYGFRFPYWDEWRLAPLIDKSYSGGLTFLDFWGQHNEHRPVFPRALALAQARLTDWNVGYEIALNLALAAAILTGLVLLAYRSTRVLAHSASLGSPSTSSALPWLLLPCFSFLVFSWAQMENWIWGWQLQIFLSTFAVVGGVALLSGGRPSWIRFAGAVALGIIASYSFANGLLYWIAALPVVIGCANASKQTRGARTIIWVACAFLVFVSYLYGYFTPDESSPSPWAALYHPLAFLGYLVLYLGGPMTGLVTRPAWHGVEWPVTAIQFAPGLLAITAFAALSYVLIVRRRVPFATVAPWLALATYAVGGAMITGAGRVGFGLGHALMSRYMMIAMLFWCALAAMAALFIITGQTGRRGMIPRPLCVAALAVFIIIGQFLFVHNNRYWEDISRWKQMGWEGIRAGNPARLYLQDLCYDPEALRDTYLPILEAHDLCGFDDYPHMDPARAEAFVKEAERFIQEEKWIPAGIYLETALVLDPANEEAKTLYKQVLDTVNALRFPMSPLAP